MDYNSIDEDDVENLRLAALMTLKKKSNVPKSTLNTISRGFYQSKFSICNSNNNLARNNRGLFPTTNRLYNKNTYTDVDFRRPTHANNNLIAIVPIDGEIDSTSKNVSKGDKLMHISNNTELIDNQNLNNEASTKFSKFENESGSEESDDSVPEKDENEKSDDGDFLSLGEEDEDLDDLDKLMDIMEAEIAGKDAELSKKENKSLKQKNINETGTILKVLSKLTDKTDEPVLTNQSEIIKDTKSIKEESKTMKTSEEIKNSPYNLLKSHFPLRFLSPPKKKRSISPYNKLPKRSSRSPTHGGYGYLPLRSKPYRSSLSPRRSSRRLSPPRETICSPRLYSPTKFGHLYHSPSPQRPLSRDISPSKKRSLSPSVRRSRFPIKSKSKSRSPKVRPAIRRRSPSPLKKKVIRSRPVSPNILCKHNIMDDNYLKKRERVKQVESRPIDPVLEARIRKFETNKPVDLISKKICLKNTNLVQAAIQTVNKKTGNEKFEPEIKSESMHLVKKVKQMSQAFQAQKNVSITMNNVLETVNLQRVTTFNTSPGKINNKKRPRIVFRHDETNNSSLEKEDRFDQSNEKTNVNITEAVQYETSEMSSTSEEKLKKEGSEIIKEEESEKEVNDKKISRRNNDVDLRTELKRRRALRLNMVQPKVKRKPESFCPARLLQSAIRGVVYSSSSNEVKRNNNSKIPEKSIRTKDDEDYDSEVESCANAKRLKDKLKIFPVHLRTVDFNNTIQKGLRKVIKRNINVTDFNQI